MSLRTNLNVSAALALLLLTGCRPVGDDYTPQAPTTGPAPEPQRISFVSGAGQHDPEQWGQVSVAHLLMWHAHDAKLMLRGKILDHSGPNPEHVGGHRMDTREVA